MFDKMNGSFGSENPSDYAEKGTRSKKSFFKAPSEFGISSERKIDIVAACVSVLLLILTIALWNTISDTLFYQLLYPLLSTGGKIILIVLVILIIVMFIRFRIRRRFGRWY